MSDPHKSVNPGLKSRVIKVGPSNVFTLTKVYAPLKVEGTSRQESGSPHGSRSRSHAMLPDLPSPQASSCSSSLTLELSHLHIAMRS